MCVVYMYVCVSVCVCCLTPQLKVDVDGRVVSWGAGSSRSSGLPPDPTSVEELMRAFELVEVSSPGITDLFLRRIFVHLEHRCVCVWTFLCVCVCVCVRADQHSRLALIMVFTSTSLCSESPHN